MSRESQGKGGNCMINQREALQVYLYKLVCLFPINSHPFKQISSKFVVSIDVPYKIYA